METEAVAEDPMSDEPARQGTLVDRVYADAPIWMEAAVAGALDEDEERTHRKRGPTRGRGDGQQKRKREVSDMALEEEVAYAVGLDAYGMNEHEAGLLADDLDEEAYFQVRNHILTRWRADVLHFLSEDEAAAKILPKHRHLVTTAWRYLDRHGWINWGVAPDIIARPKEDRQETVIIIGAGLAGLSAARQLVNHGYRVVVLEGNDRPGGRVYTARLEGPDGQAAVADLGGSIITGIDGNPLAAIAQQLGIPMHDINSSDVPLYMSDGSQLDQEVDMQVEDAFNQLLDRSAALRDELGAGGDAVSLQASLNGLWQRREARIRRQEQQQHQCPVSQQPAAADTANGQHHKAYQQQQRAPMLGQLPPQQQHRQQDELQGQHQKQRRVADTFSTQQARHLLLHWHLANIEFANATRLRCLSMRHWDLDDEHEHQGAHVFLPGGNLRLIEGLAQGIPIFYKTPAKLLQYSSTGVQAHTDAGVFAADAALVTIPLGVLKRKDGMAFLPPLPARKRAAIKRLGFGCLNKVMMLFPHCFWGGKDMFGHVCTSTSQRGLYYLFYTYDSISGGAVLAALVAGDAAVAFERRTQQECVHEVMQLLRGIFEPQGITVPQPLQAVCTAWGSDPMCYGSYSSVAVGSSGAADYDALAKPLGNKVFFAGEATTSRYPATMHGAFATGLREAANIMIAFAEQRGEELRPKIGEAMEGADAASAAAGQQLLRLADLLQQVFEPASCEDNAGGCSGPDEEFGLFKAVYGPAGSRFADKALVAVDMSGLRGNAKHAPVTIYITLGRHQLELLRDVPGGDERRIGVLTSEMCIKLVGRPLDSDALMLLEAIVHHRGLQVVPAAQDIIDDELGSGGDEPTEHDT